MSHSAIRQTKGVVMLDFMASLFVASTYQCTVASMMQQYS